MINIIDTSAKIYSAFSDERFVLDKWAEYIDREIPAVKELCLADMKESVSAGYPWDSYFLPVLNAVVRRKEEVEKTVRSFYTVVDRLDERITGRFGRSMDIDIILYLGLCSGAGWVTEVRGKTSILLGIEKILELQWNNTDDMNGLILHELGHAYQAEYGVLQRDCQNGPDEFLWQLFTEGIAMVFEQEVLQDADYYHQDRNGWKAWCDRNLSTIVRDFDQDLHTMTRESQRYFGDWVHYRGHSDVGYYLGTRFVRSILEKDEFDRVIHYETEDVRRAFGEFAASF